VALARGAISDARYNRSVSTSQGSKQAAISGAAGATILAVDYGRARIGLAIASMGTRLAEPLGTLERVNRNEDMRRLRELVREHEIKQIVVGLPLLLDGTRGEMAEETERFAQRVRKQIGVPVEMMDERLTSWEAERLLEEEYGRKYHDETDKKKKKTAAEKPTVDSVAAAVILREYLAKHDARSVSK
jgi:putative holliday junction resolvase